MTKQREPQETFFERMAGFERQNPKIIDALSRYSVTMQTYQTALRGLYEPRIVFGNSTVRIGRTLL